MNNYFSRYISRNKGVLTWALGALSLSSCDKGFADLNKNPNAVSAPVPAYIFTKALYDGGGYNGHYGTSETFFLMGTMQYTTSYNDVAGFGSKYISSQITQSAGPFNAAYPDEINELGIIIKAVKNDPSKVNLLASARIWRVYCFSKITDIYGDIPYFQAGLGYDSALYKPAYDAQKDIYPHMLSELESAAQSLDASKPTFGAADLIYGGNTAQWKKFAYSLMLRLGMRLTKVDANAAQSWVTKAIAGGVITQDIDIAKISYIDGGQDINKNPLLLNMWNADYISQNGTSNPEGGKYQQKWIDSLKAHNDPRLPVISVVYTAPKTTDNTVALQKGMPDNLPNAKPGNFGTYSEPNPKTVLLLGSPRLIFSAAEGNYLLAEAALRGWYNGATAAASFDAGIRAAMRQWTIIAGSAGAIAPADIDTYAGNNQLNTGASFDEQMRQLYTEFWVSIFPNAQEAWNAYRRTGWPALTPNNYPTNATGGKIFRRGQYPISEKNLNGDNYNAAVSRQGADDLMTHVWWDK